MASVEMELFFRCGEAARKTQYYLASRQGGLSMDSLVCQKCWSLMLHNRQKSPSFLVDYLERMKNAEVKGGLRARAERCGMLKVMQQLADGRAVSLEERMELFNKEREAANTGVVEGDYLRRITMDLFVEIGENIDDVYVKTFSPDKLSLFNDDSRRSYTYIVPNRLALSYVVELDQNLRCVRSESKLEQTEESEVGRMGVRSRGKEDSHSECTDLELVVKAGKIVYRDIMHSPLNDGRLVSPESQINSAVPNLVMCTHES